ncbi:hypothetical protein Dsin_016307 [Dipteronia sinensis]|uniref:Uncharacterized protein n=1 Tax=Dipteronia sinensis TaxID=43782 RepID=A0AAE0ACU7_9ROSI|nr:hypothetical protein Dsin_016307 [Dipteronia sinensis]
MMLMTYWPHQIIDVVNLTSISVDSIVDAMTDPVVAHMSPLIDPPMAELQTSHTIEGEVSSNTDNEGTESDFKHPTALATIGIHGRVSWTDQIEDSETSIRFLELMKPLVISLLLLVMSFWFALAVCDLVDIETKWAFYTHIGRGRHNMVLSRLDRAVCSPSFLDAWSHISFVILTRLHSNHHPLLVSYYAGVSSGPRPFREWYVSFCSKLKAFTGGFKEVELGDWFRFETDALADLDKILGQPELPSYNEVRVTVFNIDPLSAPGPDDFLSRFYCHCWDIVGSDVVLPVSGFFRTSLVFLGMDSNFMVLILKLSIALTVDQFCPIALGNFLFKIISKGLGILEVIWCPPPPGCLKVNTDEAAFGSLSLVSCAEVFVLIEALLRTALLFLLSPVLLLRLSWRMPYMQLIMLGPLVGVSCGWKVILLMWWPSFVIGLVRFLGVGVQLGIGV